MPDVNLNDGYKPDNTGDVKIDDGELNKDKLTVSTFADPKKGEFSLMTDGSKLQTMYDGAGNKVQVRFFPGHRNILLVKIYTSPNGEQRGIVVSQSGEAKLMPGDLFDKAMTASGDEIARTTGIRSTKYVPPIDPIFPTESQQKSASPVYSAPTQSEPAPNQPSEAPAQDNPVSDDSKPASANPSGEKQNPQTNPQDKQVN